MAWFLNHLIDTINLKTRGDKTMKESINEAIICLIVLYLILYVAIGAL